MGGNAGGIISVRVKTVKLPGTLRNKIAIQGCLSTNKKNLKTTDFVTPKSPEMSNSEQQSFLSDLRTRMKQEGIDEDKINKLPKGAGESDSVTLPEESIASLRSSLMFFAQMKDLNEGTLELTLIEPGAKSFIPIQKSEYKILGVCKIELAMIGERCPDELFRFEGQGPDKSVFEASMTISAW